MATPQDIGTGIMPIVSELKRMNDTLDRINNALLAIALGSDDIVNAIQKSEKDEPEAIPPIVPPSPISIIRANVTDLMHYEGSQMFYNGQTCNNGCPKAHSCIEYQPGEKCIGWKTRNFRRKDK